jgi:CheY-specific phosphatase CheX
VNPSSDDLARITAAIWSTQLGLELDVADPKALVQQFARDAIACVVEFAGDFNGSLIHRCSHELAVMAAAAAFPAAGGDLGAGDLRDTVAELAHMTAGNLKLFVPGRTTVSIARTLKGGDEGGAVIAEVGFLLDNEPLVVTLNR